MVASLHTMNSGLSHLHGYIRLSHATVYKIRLFAFSSEISQRIFVKIHCENAEFGSLRDPGLLQVKNLQQPPFSSESIIELFFIYALAEILKI